MANFFKVGDHVYWYGTEDGGTIIDSNSTGRYTVRWDNKKDGISYDVDMYDLMSEPTNSQTMEFDPDAIARSLAKDIK